MQMLFNIPSPLKWSTDQVANVIAIVSAAATVAALWYAFYRNRKQDKKINDLAEITKKLAAQNELLSEQNHMQKLSMKEEVRPEFVRGGTNLSGQTGTILFKICNKGYRAVVTEIEYKEDDVTFEKKSTPKLVPTDKELHFTCTTKGTKHINDCNWGVIIHYRDTYNNTYQLAVFGQGDTIKSLGVTE